MHVPAASHGAFFAGTPKIVVAARDAVRWRAVECPADVLFFRFMRDDRGTGRIDQLDTAEGAPSVGLALPPSQCLGLIALSADGKRELEALADWWSARTRGETPDVVMLDADTNLSDALARFLAGGLLRNALAASRTIVQLRRDLAELREEHETTHTILTMLGRAVSRWQVPPLSCELVLHPGSSALGPTRDGEAFGLRQRLPIPSQGLAAIALHMVKGTAVASGRLLVALNARESGVNLVTWGVPYDQVTSGWIFWRSRASSPDRSRPSN